MYVTKASGEKELLSKSKYFASLERSGVPAHMRDEIFEQIMPKLYDGISTHKLYKMTHKLLLKHQQKGGAGHYNLKQALIQLGPSGYPFENFIARLLAREGYNIHDEKIVEGHCISHEIDVVCNKGNESLFVECKFHNTQKRRSDVKVPLYVWARCEDIKTRQKEARCMIVTNTKFTSVALDYGRCVRLEMISWGYPDKGNLASLVYKHGMHPITCLASLSAQDQKKLIAQGIVLCQELSEQSVSSMRALGFNEGKAQKIVNESRDVCSHRHND